MCISHAHWSGHIDTFVPSSIPQQHGSSKKELYVTPCLQRGNVWLILEWTCHACSSSWDPESLMRLLA